MSLTRKSLKTRRILSENENIFQKGEVFGQNERVRISAVYFKVNKLT